MAGSDLRDGLLAIGVDENVACSRDDEVGSQVAAAHVVQVADDPKRRDGGGKVRIAQPREFGVAGGRCRPSRRKQVIRDDGERSKRDAEGGQANTSMHGAPLPVWRC
jgi:hypothetical protein